MGNTQRESAFPYVLVLLIGSLTVMGLSIPAPASITGGCTGSATIDGVPYGGNNDTPSNAIVIPDRNDVAAKWSGKVPFANTNHSGTAGIRVGPVVVGVADWDGDNVDDVRSASGDYSLDDLRGALPVDVGVAGIYEVIVEHRADGGACRANVFIDFEGNPLSTPLGIFSVVGLGLSALGLIAGMFSKGT